MRRKYIISEDGSATLTSIDFQESYHSIHGAVSESRHIFINNGLNHYLSTNSAPNNITILEAGLGTGLNFLLTAMMAESLTNESKITYIAIEKYPVTSSELALLNYPELFSDPEMAASIFTKMESAVWGVETDIGNKLILKKIEAGFEETFPTIESNSIDIIYFDPFSPVTQPQLWQVSIFKELYRSLKCNGILVTYSSKGIVKQALRESGFVIERLKGPKGKRHILRATKR